MSGQLPEQFLLGVGTILLIAVHVIALGYWSLRALRFRADDIWAKAAVASAAGFGLLGVYTLILGHVGLLIRTPFLISAGVSAAGLLVAWSQLSGWAKAGFSEISKGFRHNPFLSWACVLMLVMMVVSGLREPFMIDETEYQWAAPVFWAAHGHWLLSPYHNTNGASFGQIIYTVPAVFGSYVGAHWTHSLFLLILVGCVAALTKKIGGRAVGAIAVCLSCPVIMNQSSITYSDILSGAFAAAAYTALFCGGVTLPTVIVAGFLFAADVSSKTFMVMAMPVAAVYVAWPYWIELRRTHSLKLSPLALRLAILGLPAVLAVIGWGIRGKYVLGAPNWETVWGGHRLAKDANDPIIKDGQASGRIPHLRDFIELPFVPIYTSVLGQNEPYGGRTGLLLVLFVPMGFYFTRRFDPGKRTAALWVLAAGAGFFLLLGPVCIKTRYHEMVWAMLACFAGVAVEVMANASMERRRLGYAVFGFMMLLGMADIGHVLLAPKGAVSPFQMFAQETVASR